MKNQETWTVIPNNILEILYGDYLSKIAIKYYLYLRRYKNNESGKAWPSVRRTLKEMTISMRDIKIARDELIKRGLIIETKYKGKNTEITFNDKVLLIKSYSSDIQDEWQGVTQCE